MIFFDFADFRSVVLLFVILFGSSFLLYFPLLYFTNKNMAIKLAVPFSLSIEIIVGYLFYSTNMMKYFSPTYFSIALLLNIFCIYKMKFVGKIDLKKFLPKIGLGIILSIPLLYVYFYDALRNIAPGNSDTHAHVLFIKEIAEKGFIERSYYAPGLHIISYPITYFLNLSDFYRFIGPVLGLIILSSVYLIFRDVFKNKFSGIIFFLLACLPPLNSVILTLISFWPTTLSLVFFCAFVYISSYPKEISEKKLLILYIIFSLALSFSVPYLYVQFIPVLFLLYLISLFTHKRGALQPRFLLKLVAISIVGILVSFGHVYLQTKVIGRGGTFPQISIEGTEGVQKEESNKEFEKEIKGDDSSFVSAFLKPMYLNGVELIKPKLVRSPFQRVSLNTYAWFIVVTVLAAYEIRRKKNYLLISLFTFASLFGFLQITGILENTLYRGRVGFYFLILALPCLAYILGRIKLNRYISYGLIILLYFYTFTNHPMFPRGYCTTNFEQVYKIEKKFPKEKIVIIPYDYRVDIVSQRIKFLSITEKSANVVNKDNHTFLMLSTGLCYEQPSKEAVATDINLKIFSQRYKYELAFLKNWNKKIKAEPGFAKYSLYWSDDNTEIYEKYDR